MNENFHRQKDVQEADSGKRGVHIFDDQGNLLYWRQEFSVEKYVELRGLPFPMFFAYLQKHFPSNHWVLKALAEEAVRGTIRTETLQDLSQEIELSEQDAKNLKAFAELAAQRGLKGLLE
jgi:hypothetical protein